MSCMQFLQLNMEEIIAEAKHFFYNTQNNRQKYICEINRNWTCKVQDVTIVKLVSLCDVHQCQWMQKFKYEIRNKYHLLVSCVQLCMYVSKWAFTDHILRRTSRKHFCACAHACVCVCVSESERKHWISHRRFSWLAILKSGVVSLTTDELQKLHSLLLLLLLEMHCTEKMFPWQSHAMIVQWPFVIL